MKTAKIGLLGFGNVGGGTYKILTDNKQIIEKRTGISPEIVKILQRNKKKKRFASADPALLTEDPDDIIKNPEIDIVVEMLGGIEPATSSMVQAMKAGKHVVSANKAAIAANYGLLHRNCPKSGVRFLFEASVAGGIPVLTSITGALQSNNFIEIMGILNGTTNYILTKMTEESLSYEEVLKDAQDKGFAEADPTADVEGIDAANKLSILMALSFDKYVAPEDIPTKGISKITDRDTLFCGIAEQSHKAHRHRPHGRRQTSKYRVYSLLFLTTLILLRESATNSTPEHITGDMVGEGVMSLRQRSRALCLRKRRYAAIL